MECKYFKKSFEKKDGIVDSVNTCFVYYKSKNCKIILDNSIKPDFIRQDEEFRELLQYLIIMGEYSWSNYSQNAKLTFKLLIFLM